MNAPRLLLDWPLRCLPPVRSAGVFPMIVPGCNHSYRSHETIALHLHDYAGEMWIDKKRFVLLPGDITISPLRLPTTYALPEGGTHLCIHFHPKGSLPRGGKISIPLYHRLGSQVLVARERFWRIIDDARRAGDHMNSAASCAASASLQELLLWLYSRRKGSKPQRSSLVEEALIKLNHAIEASLAKPMLIGDLAANVGLSPEYVARVFAQRYGMTLQRHLLLRRIELARHLLVSSSLLISDIGRRVGLPDPQYFNKQFRRVAGESPLMYRKRRAHTG